MYFRYVETNTIEPWLYSIRRCGYNEAERVFSVERTNLYPYCNLHYVEEGQVEVVYGGKKYIARSGEYFILPPFKAHSYHVIGNNAPILRWIEFDGSESESLTNRIIRFNESVVVSVEKDCEEAFINSLVACGTQMPVYEKSKVLYNLLVDQLSCISHCNVNRVCTPKVDPLDSMTNYVDKHLNEELKVADLAQHFGYSTSYMIKLFKKRYDMTPGAYIYHRRIGLVKHLLVNENLPLDQIAARCGFYDAAHLVRRFKKNEGMTPMTFKAEADYYKLAD